MLMLIILGYIYSDTCSPMYAQFSSVEYNIGLIKKLYSYINELLNPSLEALLRGGGIAGLEMAFIWLLDQRSI